MSVQISYKKQALFSVILAVIILLVIEVILQTYDFYTVSCSIMESDIYKDMSYYSQKQLCNDYRDLSFLNGIDIHYIPNQHSKVVNIDNYGMRGQDIAKVKSPHTYRIFVIGGSTIFGWGSTSDSATIPGYLQKKFDRLDLPYNVQVINSGVAGAFSTQEVYWVKNKLVEFHPDMVIVYDGWNDMEAPYENLIDPSKEATPQKYVLTIIQTILPWYKTPIIAPTFLNSIIHRFSNEKEEHLRLKTDHITERSSLWYGNEKEICYLGNKTGFKTVILLQPILGTGNKTMTEYESKYYQSTGGSKNIAQYDLFAKKDNIDGLSQYCTKTADLRHVFDGNSDFLYYDQGHLQDRGNEIVANKIFGLVSPIVLKDASKLEG